MRSVWQIVALGDWETHPRLPDIDGHFDRSWRLHDAAFFPTRFALNLACRVEQFHISFKFVQCVQITDEHSKNWVLDTYNLAVFEVIYGVINGMMFYSNVSTVLRTKYSTSKHHSMFPKMSVFAYFWICKSVQGYWCKQSGHNSFGIEMNGRRKKESNQSTGWPQYSCLKLFPSTVPSPHGVFIQGETGGQENRNHRRLNPLHCSQLMSQCL